MLALITVLFSQLANHSGGGAGLINAWRNISFAMRLPYYFSGYSISQQPQRLENTLPSQALTPGCFQLALVETWPDCCYLQLHIQPVFFLSSTFLFKSEIKTVLCLKIK